MPDTAIEKNAPSPTAGREIVITRLFDAPRELVFRAWTDPQHLVHWWGPKGFTNTFHQADIRPGGVWRFTMHGPDGADYPNRMVFEEIVKPERLVYSHTGGENNDVAIFQGFVTFSEEGAQTRVTLRMVFPTATERDLVVQRFGAIEGGEQTFGRLARHLAMVGADAEEFTVTRTFDAPRDLVFKAWTEAARLAQWWGPKGFKMLVARLDLRPGGSFHYCMEVPEGSAMGGPASKRMWGKFVFREITPPARLVFVNSFSDEAGGATRHPLAKDWPLEVLNVATFAEFQGKTTLTITGIPINATEAERSSFKAGHSSMQAGFQGALDQLDQHLAGAAK
jgi:uncharacterized protein YndB with AHSA1/START domain